MTSAATARARARRQLQHGDAVPEILPSSPASRATTRPNLRIVPRPESTATSHRSTLSKLSMFVVGLSIFIILVIVFQATIAEQQLRLDRVSGDLRMAETHYDNLRQQRAELLAPARLREEAMMLGMYQGLTAKFVEVPAEVIAAVLISTADMDPMFADPPAGVAAERALRVQEVSTQSAAQPATPSAAAQQPAAAPQPTGRKIIPIGNEAMMP